MAKNSKSTHQNQPPDLGECLATNYIAEGKQQVGFMYREQPEDEFDSGWRFLTGTEDDEYMDNPANYSMIAVDYLLSIDPSVRNFLSRSIGTELERVENTNRFEVYAVEE